jgi:hypothetical protein
MNILIGAQLNQYTPEHQSQFTFELDEPKQLSLILDSLQIPLDMVHLLIINGRISHLDGAMVANQDKVIVYPYITGG